MTTWLFLKYISSRLFKEISVSRCRSFLISESGLNWFSLSISGILDLVRRAFPFYPSDRRFFSYQTMKLTETRCQSLQNHSLLPLLPLLPWEKKKRRRRKQPEAEETLGFQRLITQKMLKGKFHHQKLFISVKRLLNGETKCCFDTDRVS